jgi:flagellar biosynthetic protein FliP
MASKLTPQMQLSIGPEKSGGLKLSGTVGIVVMMGLLTLLPAIILMMTGFTRILIVLHFLRQAIGAQSAPPAQLVAGLALLLTLFVMAPTIDAINTNAISPWMEGRIEQTQMLKEGAKPLRAFMLRQTRERDLERFMRLSHAAPVATPDDVPLVVLASAFVTNELRVSFQIGFALFLPFIVIDIVVASVLMSMGMMMVPPAMISLPFKLLLFVLVDGWGLVVQGLIESFR